MDPKEVHEIGLKEVARIQEQLEKVKTDVNFCGTLKKVLLLYEEQQRLLHRQ